MTSLPLPKAPSDVIGRDGMPHLGKLAGQTGPIDCRTLGAPYARGRLWRRFHHKRWQYAALGTDEVFCAVAVMDLGWIATAFAYVFDRARGEVVAAYSRTACRASTRTSANGRRSLRPAISRCSATASITTSCRASPSIV